LVSTGQLVQQDITLTQGKHTIAFKANLTQSGAGEGLKLELKTAGLPYQIKQ
jgi:hypothetical protein